MTENEAIKILKKTTEHTKVYEDDVVFTSDFVKAYEKAIHALEELQQYRAIGTIDEFKALKEKNEPKELAEHNFQDEVHYYLCPSCRSIVSCNQNYCDECGQALET